MFEFVTEDLTEHLNNLRLEAERQSVISLGRESLMGSRTDFAGHEVNVRNITNAVVSKENKLLSKLSSSMSGSGSNKAKVSIERDNRKVAEGLGR
ncbi:hypothetical protein [Xylocopilactobacillus apicola]|uniref:Uncharacterized protein n=1 Tax=Xylocopilactobacillus apicola TaxID=2932184 RepID=A0AAU9CZL7_9LACO|nr:hypothetical protein [Xylocopilactobacillus apicola]BDR59429.1 hypothetical protein XA3_18700 [Xylocopilactobacillus apicola]